MSDVSYKTSLISSNSLATCICGDAAAGGLRFVGSSGGGSSGHTELSTGTHTD